MPEITGLGHVGLFCHDLRTMRDFYARVLGLTISDEDLERGICFLSAAPEAEHHELALVQAKEPAQKTHNVQQVSFKVKTLDDGRSASPSTWTHRTPICSRSPGRSRRRRGRRAALSSRSGERYLVARLPPARVSPITATAWISISTPGRAKLVTVMRALAGKLPSGNSSRRISTKRSP